MNPGPCRKDSFGSGPKWPAFRKETTRLFARVVQSFDAGSVTRWPTCSAKFQVWEASSQLLLPKISRTVPPTVIEVDALVASTGATLRSLPRLTLLWSRAFIGQLQMRRLSCGIGDGTIMATPLMSLPNCHHTHG